MVCVVLHVELMLRYATQNVVINLSTATAAVRCFSLKKLVTLLYYCDEFSLPATGQQKVHKNKSPEQIANDSQNSALQNTRTLNIVRFGYYYFVW